MIHDMMGHLLRRGLHQLSQAHYSPGNCTFVYTMGIPAQHREGKLKQRAMVRLRLCSKYCVLVKMD